MTRRRYKRVSWRHFVFVHGYNVNPTAAREWANAMFKRLWLSGSRARFHGISWYGDYHLVSGQFNGLHYHRDVYHALKTASAFSDYVTNAQPNAQSRVLMAQSLGNMLVCESLRQGLHADKYLMFDAAIPSEAFDGSLQASRLEDESFLKYVPSDWHSYTNLSWAANWHRWFPNDARGGIGWPDQFADALDNVDECYNYYSSGDEVFEETATTPSMLSGVFHWPTFQLSWPFVNLSSIVTPEVNPWQKQEVLKGVDLTAGTMTAGWGFHCWPESTPETTEWLTYSADDAALMVENGSIVTNSVFARNVPAMFDPQMSLDERHYILAFAIPAVSSAVGKISVLSQPNNNLDMNVINTNLEDEETLLQAQRMRGGR